MGEELFCLVVWGETGRKWINISVRYVASEMLDEIFNWKFLTDKRNSGDGAQVKENQSYIDPKN